MSRPGELHPQPLVERYVSLSTHTAPIRRTTCRLTHGCVFIRISSWTVQLDTDKTTRRRPFAPSPLQRLHHYYERLRPSASHRYSGFLWGHHLNGSLGIETTGSRSSVEKPRIRLTPPARRTPPGQASGQPPDFSRRYHPPSVSMSCTGSRRVNGGSLAFVFLIHTCRVMLDVSPTLTTTTLNDSRLGWFEAGS